MTYLLDTNACIRYLNGQASSLRQHLIETDPRDIVLCSIVKAELYHGALKSARPRENLAKLQRFFSPFVSLGFNDDVAMTYGKIRADLESTGQIIGPNDLLIAAIARTYKLTLVTHNTREFSRVEGLDLEDWEA